MGRRLLLPLFAATLLLAACEGDPADPATDVGPVEDLPATTTEPSDDLPGTSAGPVDDATTDGTSAGPVDDATTDEGEDAQG
ncbi:hypothetical protein FTX61_08385 [Nitriliruptoraceae bacterium ZYF776]|nr:hypothetical protein [Profundirhabdus halotolerans]